MDCLERIKELLNKRGWSMYQLAKMSEIPQSTLSNLFARSNSPTISTLEKICQAFGITLEEFFQSKQNVDFEREELISEYSRLSDKSKRALINFLKTLD